MLSSSPSDASLDYKALCRLLESESTPAMLVDLDAFDHNLKVFVDAAQKFHKTIRPATKSLRVPSLLKRLAKLGGQSIKGWMCYSAAEAAFLSEIGLDDFLVAYPTIQNSDLQIVKSLQEHQKTITLMIDSKQHIDLLTKRWKDLDGTSTDPIRVAIDIDVSLKKFGQHLGVQRSPVRGLEQLRKLIQQVRAQPMLKLVGAMTYEAQVAGLADRSPHQRLLNPVIRKIKIATMKWLPKYRQQIRDVFADEQVELEFFNGGGSGCLELTASDNSLTEVTAGSGFLQSHLFDHYAENRCQPALFFALSITRIPQAGRVTCQSGGFIASGSPGADRQPTIYSPSGVKIDSREGFGEVQTPLLVSKEMSNQLRVGDPVFFRPAKAGEIAERFSEYILFRGDQIVERVRTYRGLGGCFF